MSNSIPNVSNGNYKPLTEIEEINPELTKKVLSMNTDNELAKRGRQLRLQIDKTLIESKGKFIDPVKGIDMGNMVSKYIPEGTSFDDAEIILKFAGCEVTKRGRDRSKMHNPTRESVDGYVSLKTNFVSRIEFIIVMETLTRGDFSKVGEISAGLFFKSL
jgi:hypothetical protein